MPELVASAPAHATIAANVSLCSCVAETVQFEFGDAAGRWLEVASVLVYLPCEVFAGARTRVRSIAHSDD